jgi:hypothetical protein
MIKLPLVGIKSNYLCVLFDDEDSDIAYSYNWQRANFKGNSVGYAQVSRRRRGAATLHIHAARLVLEKKLGRPLKQDEIAEHKNRNSLDNRRENLRPANFSENNLNKERSKSNLTGYKGVSFKKADIYRASFNFCNGTSPFLFDTYDKIEAAIGYDFVACLLSPEFCLLNFQKMTQQERWERLSDSSKRHIFKKLYSIERIRDELLSFAGASCFIKGLKRIVRSLKKPAGKRFKNVYLDSRSGKWSAQVSQGGKRVLSSPSRDEENIARCADVISYFISISITGLQNSKGDFNFPDESFEEKWRLIGSPQRVQIVHSLDRNGLLTDEIREIVGGIK